MTGVPTRFQLQRDGDVRMNVSKQTEGAQDDSLLPVAPVTIYISPSRYVPFDSAPAEARVLRSVSSINHWRLQVNS